MNLAPTITTTWLEMDRPENPDPFVLLPNGWSVRRAEGIPLHFYRYLYNAVGGAWIWNERVNFADDELNAFLQDSAYYCFVVYCQAYPAGLIELDGRKHPEIELKYFGLIPEWCGKNKGPVFLRWAIAQAWSLGAARFWLHTCTDDHPGALRTYQRAGFSAFRVETAPRLGPESVV